MSNTNQEIFRAPPNDPFRNSAMSAVLARNWWTVLLRGLFAIIFGLIAIFMPGTAMLSLVIVFAAYTLVDGVFSIIGAVRAAQTHGRWGMLLLSGIVDIITGIVAFLWPGITVLVFVLLIAAWAIVSGALIFASAFRLHVDHGRIWLALGGLASLVFGILMILAPLAGAVVLTWWIGIYALIFGGFLVVLAFQLRARHQEHTMTGAAQPA